MTRIDSVTNAQGTVLSSRELKATDLGTEPLKNDHPAVQSRNQPPRALTVTDFVCGVDGRSVP